MRFSPAYFMPDRVIAGRRSDVVLRGLSALLQALHLANGESRDKTLEWRNLLRDPQQEDDEQGSDARCSGDETPDIPVAQLVDCTMLCIVSGATTRSISRSVFTWSLILAMPKR